MSFSARFCSSHTLKSRAVKLTTSRDAVRRTGTSSPLPATGQAWFPRDASGPWAGRLTPLLKRNPMPSFGVPFSVLCVRACVYVCTCVMSQVLQPTPSYRRAPDLDLLLPRGGIGGVKGWAGSRCDG